MLGYAHSATGVAFPGMSRAPPMHTTWPILDLKTSPCSRARHASLGSECAVTWFSKVEYIEAHRIYDAVRHLNGDHCVSIRFCDNEHVHD